ncbi:MAG: hypothetical protein H7210_09635 [Pyrinomonadaceae bacterium]|nr:hypothetical protein [Phycisphaerales bacterium]
MGRCIPSTFAILAALSASTAFAQGELPYNRGINPSSVRYEPRPSGGMQVSAELLLSTDGAATRDLSCTMTLRVNGAVVGNPASLPIEASPAGQVSCGPDWCERVCGGGFCRNIYNWICICVSFGNDDGHNSQNRIALPVPPLQVGDVVTLSLEAMSTSLPEIEPGDDHATLVIGPPPCRADLNADGKVTSQDFFQFLTAFFDSAPLADMNGDGEITSQDFFDFIAAFFAGC